MKARVGGLLLFFWAFCTVSWADSDDLKVMDHDGFFDQRYHSSYFEKYQESPNFTMPASAEQTFDAIAMGADIDVVYVCSYELTKWIEAGLIEPWDSGRALRTGFGTQVVDLSKDMEALAPYLVPFEFGRMMPIYNSSQVPHSDVKSLDIFVNPQYRRQIALPANSTLLFSVALLATGVDDWSAVSEDQYTAALDWLRKAHGNHPYYSDDVEDVAELLARGEVLVAWSWNVVAFNAKQYNQSITFVHEPTEGSAAFVCGYVNVKGPAGDSARAYDFVNSVSSADPIEILLRWGDGHAYSEVMRSKLSEDEIFERGLAIPDGPMLFLSGLPFEMQKRSSIDIARIKSGY